MIRTMMVIPLATILLACGLVTRSDDPANPQVTGDIVVGPPPSGGSMASSSGDSALPLYAGDSLIEEKVIENPVIVRATMTSFSSDTVIDHPNDTYNVVLKFNLNVSEYLKGTGPSSIVAVWIGSRNYATRPEAEDAKAIILADRDGQWDDREALFFLWDAEGGFGPWLDANPEFADYYFLGLGDRYSPDDRYSLHSTHNKKWLPAATSTSSTGDSQEFLLDVPPPTETITLGELKRKITEVTAELNGGDGSERYRECVLEKYQHIRNQRNTPEERGGAFTVWNVVHRLVSGLPAGTVLDQGERGGGYPDIKVLYWLEGRDSALFDIVDGPSTGIDKDGDGDYDNIKYDRMVQLARPLPVGEYRFDLKEPRPRYAICNFVISNEWTVTATAPDGTLHEAFFDPVTVGTTVKADATNGVLKPTTFTDSNGASATIASLGWESGTVKLEVDPHTVLSGHHMDFIELDGTISLSLDVSNATADAANDTLSWSVESQPWEDGDKLMVRIREAPPSCSNSGVVPDARSEPALAGDCETLLGLRDALAGTGSLNWGLDTAITSWDGVTVGGTPRRVTRLDLVSGRLTGVVPLELSKLTGLEYLQLGFNRLTGGIPVELGSMVNLRFLELSGNRLTGPVPLELSNLSNLTGLWLNTNRLTGPIPPELGDLSNLEGLGLSRNMLTGGIPVELGNLTELGELRLYENQLTGTIPSVLRRLTNLWLLQLAGNSLVGCLPPELRSITINDFGRLGLPDCAEGLVAAPDDLMVSLADGTFSMTWTAVSGADRYEVQRRIAGSGDDWAALPATESVSASFTPEGGLVCGTTYEFRARSHGDGLTHVTEWGEESAPVSVTTEMCNRDPSFDPASYTFSVSEDAETDDGVGSVSATDPDEGDAVTYAITQGNTGGAFAVNGSTGEITVAGTLDHETDSSHTLTVQASDGRGGTATTTVEITVTDVAEDPPPAPSGPQRVPGGRRLHHILDGPGRGGEVRGPAP